MGRRKMFSAALILGLVCIACLLGCRRLYTSAGETRLERVRTETFSARLYHPGSAEETNPAPAVLVVGENAQTNRALGLELSRRGYVALTLPREKAAPAALDWLAAQPFVQAGRLALVGETRELLSLGCRQGNLQAVVGCGFDCVTEPPETYNCLLFARSAPPVRELAAFLRCEEAEAEIDDIQGYFSRESARCLVLTGEKPVFRDKAVQARLYDWLGSSISHRIEIPDEDQRWTAGETLRFLALLSGGLCLCLTMCLLGKNTMQQPFRED